VTRGVAPLHPTPAPEPEDAGVAPPAASVPDRRGPDRRGIGPRRAGRPLAGAERAAPAAPETLDGRWDRRLSSGRAQPDRVIDLHGLTREGARAALYEGIAAAEARGERLILVITGKGAMPGPAPADLMPGLGGGATRGAIRADLPRWLGEAGISGRIAAVRRAHPRHGGAGAAYLILRRSR
jgi:DNA-nicking Smr family endonuclease